jgi:hypothetical protein
MRRFLQTRRQKRQLARLLVALDQAANGPQPLVRRRHVTLSNGGG